jgi:hypothetical protein
MYLWMQAARIDHYYALAFFDWHTYGGISIIPVSIIITVIHYQTVFRSLVRLWLVGAGA